MAIQLIALLRVEYATGIKQVLEEYLRMWKNTHNILLGF